MKEPSIFVDESEDIGIHSAYYFVALVFHEQADPIAEPLTKYETALANAQLDDTPFHIDPLLNGHNEYKRKNVAARKRQLSYFAMMVQHLPSLTERLGTRRTSVSTSPASLPPRLKKMLMRFSKSIWTIFSSLTMSRSTTTTAKAW